MFHYSFYWIPPKSRSFVERELSDGARQEEAKVWVVKVWVRVPGNVFRSIRLKWGQRLNDRKQIDLVVKLKSEREYRGIDREGHFDMRRAATPTQCADWTWRSFGINKSCSGSSMYLIETQQWPPVAATCMTNCRIYKWEGNIYNTSPWFHRQGLS